MACRGLFQPQPSYDFEKFQKAASSSLLFCKQGKISNSVCLIPESYLLYAAEEQKVMKTTCLTDSVSKQAPRKTAEISLTAYTEH